ncbi:unnamed protein product [Ectocarpus sp. 12 AP-2014]
MARRGRVPDQLLVAASILPSLALFGQIEDPSARGQLQASAALATLGYLATIYVLPTFTPFLARSGLTGKDLCKKGTASAEKEIPEGTGVIAGTMFLICVVILQLFYGRDSSDKMVDYLSALLSICFMTFLGFTDDVLDLPWRYKLLLPTVATLPLLCAYDGSTSVVVPRPLDHLLVAVGAGGGGDGVLTLVGRAVSSVFSITVPGKLGGVMLLDLGKCTAYMVYMGLLAVFCTNAVNIYAGINGLEAGQSFVVACAILAHNMHELRRGRDTGNHTFSAMLLLPFIGTTLGLLRYNWYPARAFVGDTYCYFAGMTFAVVGIHGHFSKTLILMFLPQVTNFLLSLPQLFKVLPCPRHRLPRMDTEKGLLVPSTMPYKGEFPVWRFLRSGPDGEVINLTLINLVLHVVGPLREGSLCTLLLALQAASCGFGFVIRYYFAGLVYGSI